MTETRTLSQRLIAGVWHVANKELTTEQIQIKAMSLKNMLVFGLIVTLIIFGTWGWLLFIQKSEQVTNLSVQLTDKKSPEEFVKLKMVTVGDIVYVVGTQAEYPRESSEMAKDIKALTVKLNEVKQVADAALEKSNAHERIFKRLLKGKESK